MNSSTRKCFWVPEGAAQLFSEQETWLLFVLLALFFFFFFWRYYSRSVAACVCHLVTSCAWTMRNLVWVLISRQSGKFNANQAGTVWVGVTHYMHDLVSVNDVSVYILIMHVMGWQSVCRMTVGFIRVCVQRVGDLERLLATPVSDTTTIWKTTSHIYEV